MNVALFGWIQVEPLIPLIPGNKLALVKTKMEAFLPPEHLTTQPPSALVSKMLYLFLCLQICTESPSPNNSDIQMSALRGHEKEQFSFLVSIAYFSSTQHF